MNVFEKLLLAGEGGKDNPYPFMMCAEIWNPWKHTETDTETGEMITTVTPTVSLCPAILSMFKL